MTTDTLKTATTSSVQNQDSTGGNTQGTQTEITESKTDGQEVVKTTNLSPEELNKIITENNLLRESQSKKDKQLSDYKKKLAEFEEAENKKKPLEEQLEETRKRLAQEEADKIQLKLDYLKVNFINTFDWKETPAFARNLVTGTTQEELIESAKQLESQYTRYNMNLKESVIKGSTASDNVTSRSSIGEHIFTAKEIASMSPSVYAENRAKIEEQQKAGLIK